MTKTPAVVGYRVDPLAAKLAFLLKVPTIVLANLVAGENVYPEFIQEKCTAVRLARALAPLLSDTPTRQTQCAGLARIPSLMSPPGTTPSAKAAEIILDYAYGRRS